MFLLQSILIPGRKGLRRAFVNEMQKEPQKREILIDVRLFGAPAVLGADGRPIALPGRKDRALLSYLSAHAGQPQARDRLVELIWPDAAEGAGRASLRQALSTIRKALGEPAGALLVADRDTIVLRSERLGCDVAALEALAAAPAPLAPAIPTGEFLEGLSGVSAEFDSWRATEQARLAALATRLLTAAADRAEAERRLADAAALLARALTIDPLAEATHRRLMRVQAAMGRTDAALRQFRAIESLLDAELGIRPDGETLALVREIRAMRQQHGAPATPMPGDPQPLGNDPQTSGGSGPPRPDKPSVAVLPFQNIGADPDQEAFADGLSDEIVTMLCKIDRLFVVALSSTLIYKGRTVDLHQVSREQGVHHILAGSVRRAGERVRVSAQLVDAETGQQLWGDRFDRELGDIFALQDEIAREVAVALQVELTDGEQARIFAGGTRDFAAWELTVRGAELVNRHVREDAVRARALLEQAVGRDPDYAVAWCQLGWCHWSDARHFWTDSDARSLALAWEIGERAHQLDPEAAEPFALLAMTAMQQGRFDEAAELATDAARRGAGHSFVNAIAAMVHSYCGNPQEATALVRRAIRLAPVHPNWYRILLARSELFAGNPQATVDLLAGWDGYFEGLFAFPAYLIVALMETGHADEAARVASEALAAEPHFTISAWRAPLKMRNAADLARLTDALTALGLPE